MDLASKVDIDKEKAERLTGKRIKGIVDLGSPKLAYRVTELQKENSELVDLASKVDIDKEKAERLTGKRIKGIVDLGSPKLAYRVTELQKENSELEKELNRLKEESKSSNIDNTKLLELQKENSELVQDLSDLESQLYKLQSESENLSVDNTKLLELQRENDNLELQKENSELVQDLSDLESQLYKLQSESENLSVDNTKLLELQRENDNLRSELDSITGERDEAKDIVYRQLNERRKLEDEIAELKEEKKRLTDRSESIVKKNSELRAKLDTYKIKANEVEELKEEIQILRDMGGKHKAKLEALKKNLDASSDREQQMTSELQDLRDKVMHYESLEEFGAIQSEPENEVTNTKVLKLNYEYVYNDHSDGDWLGRRPNYVTVLGEKISVRYMYDILIKVVEKLEKEGYINKDFVLTCGLFASSKCRVHLKSGECKKAIYIPDLDLYFEVNLSTNDIIDYIGILLQFCDLPDETVKVSFRA